MIVPFFTVIAKNLLLGASRFPLEQLQQEFQRRGSRPIDVGTLLWWAAAVIAAIGATAVILRIVDVFRTGKPYRSSGLLFVSLCRAHGLTWCESLHLWRLARRKGLRPAAQVFLSPEVFSEPEDGDCLEMSERLADRLFPREAGAPRPVGVTAGGSESGPRLRQG